MFGLCLYSTTHMRCAFWDGLHLHPFKLVFLMMRQANFRVRQPACSFDRGSKRDFLFSVSAKLCNHRYKTYLLPNYAIIGTRQSCDPEKIERVWNFCRIPRPKDDVFLDKVVRTVTLERFEIRVLFLVKCQLLVSEKKNSESSALWMNLWE